MILSRRTWLLAHAGFFALAMAAAAFFGATYARRMSAPGGYYLVSVDDEGPKLSLRRPTTTVVALIDGLGAEEARPMNAVRWFSAHGRCLLTDVGSPSMSRPLYTVLSSGVEQDRTGVRSNEMAGPAAVQSVWEIARQHGLPVRVVSALPWWTELFPRGFDEALPPPANDFAAVRPDAVNLVHVLSVDAAGHAHGAASPAYANAVARVDDELLGFIKTVDLDETLLVLTADHGHALRGGHGGLEPRVATVITCFAGPHVKNDPALGAMKATALAPALSLLLSLPFPAQMRAVDDDLDTALSLVRSTPDTRAYLADRQIAVATFRSRNQAQLAVALGGDARGASWQAFYRERRATQTTVAWINVALIALIAFFSTERRTLLWGLGTLATVVGAFVLLRGSFDLTAINRRANFIGVTASLSCGVGIVSAVLYAGWRRNLDQAVRLQTPVVVALLGVIVAHVATFGWTVGFPLPPPALLFLPFFSTVALGTFGGLGLLACAVVALRSPPKP